MVEQSGKGGDLVPVHLHEFQRWRGGVGGHERGLGQRTFPRPAHAPEQRMVSRQAYGEALQVFQEASFLTFDAYEAL